MGAPLPQHGGPSAPKITKFWPKIAILTTGNWYATKTYAMYTNRVGHIFTWINKVFIKVGAKRCVTTLVCFPILHCKIELLGFSYLCLWWYFFLLLKQNLIKIILIYMYTSDISQEIDIIFFWLKKRNTLSETTVCTHSGLKWQFIGSFTVFAFPLANRLLNRK